MENLKWRKSKHITVLAFSLVFVIFVLMLFYKVGKGGGEKGGKVVGGENYLSATDACAYVDFVKENSRFVYEGGELFFHTYWGATATDIACGRE